MSTSFEIQKRRRHGKVGQAPGSIIIPEDALAPRVSVLSYNKTEIKENNTDDIDQVLDYVRQHPEYTHWIKIKGIGDVTLVKKVGACLDVNALVLEDITDTTQRPKFDEYDGFVVAISRLLVDNAQHQVFNEQFSILVKDNLLFTFQETYDDYFTGIYQRLQAGKGFIREEGTGYLLYALMDTLLDRYFALLDELEEVLEELQSAINTKPRRQNMLDAQCIKNILIMLQRATGPERDKMNEILHSQNPLFTPRDKTYFQDAYDHCIDIIETTGSLKELATNITDVYLSTVNNQMNDVMKILTIISSIFIPLTFIAGLYGMNFAHQDPRTGKWLPDNMPELYQPHGYLYTLLAMGVIAVMLLIIFWRKGWFDSMR